MGTRYSAVFFADASFDTALLAAALLAAVDRVDCQMSTWKPGSDLNRINAAAVGEGVAIPRELATVLACALDIGRASQGAFDICVGEQVAASGFGANARPSGADTPSSGIAGSPQMAAYSILEMDISLRHVRKRADVSLDLSGIAKGFGVDEMARVMNTFSLPDWLVGIDGEMRGRGSRPDGSSWSVAHERPVRGLREAMGVIELTDMAVATSGNYRQYRDIGGMTISHTIDPRTGKPVSNDVASATVFAETCMAADAWATAVMVLGAKAGRNLTRLHGMDAIIVMDDGRLWD